MDKWRELSPIHWVALQMSATAGSGPSWTVKQELILGFSHRWQGWDIEPSPLASWSAHEPKAAVRNRRGTWTLGTVTCHVSIQHLNQCARCSPSVMFKIYSGALGSANLLCYLLVCCPHCIKFFVPYLKVCCLIWMTEGTWNKLCVLSFLCPSCAKQGRMLAVLMIAGIGSMFFLFSLLPLHSFQLQGLMSCGTAASAHLCCARRPWRGQF